MRNALRAVHLMAVLAILVLSRPLAGQTSTISIDASQTQGTLQRGELYKNVGDKDDYNAPTRTQDYNYMTSQGLKPQTLRI